MRFEPFFVESCGNSRIPFSVSDTFGQEGFGADCDVVANGQMPGEHRLASHGQMVSGFGTSRKSDHPHNERIFTNFNIVPHMNEIVCFCTSANACHSKSTAINGIARPDFNIIFNPNKAHLRNFIMPPFVGDKPESLSPNHRS